MNKINTKRTLIEAALVHLALERAAACVLPVPDTDPPLFVAVGPAPSILCMLQDVNGKTAGPRALADVEFDHSEGGYHD